MKSYEKEIELAEQYIEMKEEGYGNPLLVFRLPIAKQNSWLIILFFLCCTASVLLDYDEQGRLVGRILAAVAFVCCITYGAILFIAVSHVYFYYRKHRAYFDHSAEESD